MLIDYYYACGLVVSPEPLFINPAKPPVGYQITIAVGMAEKIQGYKGYSTQFFFDLDGNFEHQKIWE